jgi:hypothetical protein
MLRRPRLLLGGVPLHVIQEETTGSLFFAVDD